MGFATELELHRIEKGGRTVGHFDPLTCEVTLTSPADPDLAALAAEVERSGLGPLLGEGEFIPFDPDHIKLFRCALARHGYRSTPASIREAAPPPREAEKDEIHAPARDDALVLATRA